MGLLNRLRRYWQRFVAAGRADDSSGGDPTAGTPSPAESSPRDEELPDDPPRSTPADDPSHSAPVDYAFDPDAIECRADILKETGYTPGEFITRLLEAEGGRLPQQALTEYTNLSPASVSRYLQDLEDRDVVVRLDVGREKVVFLPDAVPSPSGAERTPGDERSPG